MMSFRSQPRTTLSRTSSQGDDAETGGSLNMTNGEQDPLISRNSSPDTNTGSSTSTDLLVLIGPALLAGYIGPMH